MLFVQKKGHQSTRCYQPSKHKAGLTGRLFLSNGWTFNANYKFTNITPGDSSAGIQIGSTNHLDLTLAKSFAQGRGELMFGVSDLLTKHTQPVYTLASYSAHDTPGRTFFVRLQIKF
ncbi:MAG: TonB-dependent receptor [Phycisphaerales bacterium]